MRRLFSRLVVFGLTSIGFWTPLFAADETIILSTSETNLELNQSKSLENDAPFSDVALDDQHAAWICGRTAIWRWSMEQKTLVKLPLVDNQNDKLSKLITNGSGLYAASDKSIFQIRLNPRKIVRFDHPGEGQGQTLDLYQNNESLWWIHQNGIVQIKSGQEKKPTTFFAPELKDAEHAVFDAANLVLWVAKGGRLGVIDFRHSTPKFTVVHQAKDGFIGLEQAKGDVFAHTNYTVLRFDAVHRTLSQIIPVEDKKKLLAMDIDGNSHAYLFNDALYEYFDLQTKKHFQTKLPLPAKARIEKLTHDGIHTVVLLEDRVAGYTHLTPTLRVGEKDAKAVRKG